MSSTLQNPVGLETLRQKLALKIRSAKTPAIVFDIDKTLWDEEAGVISAVASIGSQQFGLNTDKAHQLGEAYVHRALELRDKWSEQNAPVLDLLHIGACEIIGMRFHRTENMAPILKRELTHIVDNASAFREEVWRMAFKDVEPSVSLTDEQCRKLSQELVELRWSTQHSRIYPGTLELLAGLHKAQQRPAYLTNGSDSSQHEKFNAMIRAGKDLDSTVNWDEVFDPAQRFMSGALGFAKPHPEGLHRSATQSAQAAYDTAPDVVVMCGDNILRDGLVAAKYQKQGVVPEVVYIHIDPQNSQRQLQDEIKGLKPSEIEQLKEMTVVVQSIEEVASVLDVNLRNQSIDLQSGIGLTATSSTAA